jgi:hypothetical protein
MMMIARSDGIRLATAGGVGELSRYSSRQHRKRGCRSHSGTERYYPCRHHCALPPYLIGALASLQERGPPLLAVRAVAKKHGKPCAMLCSGYEQACSGSGLGGAAGVSSDSGVVHSAYRATLRRING